MSYEGDRLVIVNESGQRLTKLDEIISANKSTHQEIPSHQSGSYLRQNPSFKHASIESINRNILKSSARERQRR